MGWGSCNSAGFFCSLTAKRQPENPNQRTCTRCCFSLLSYRLQLLRVFHDRLISEEDKSVFRAKVEELVHAR